MALVDPFDDPGFTPTARRTEALSMQPESGLVDPFDNPEFSQRPQGTDVRGGGIPAPQRIPSPSEQQAQDILAKVKSDPSRAAGLGTIALSSFADEPESIVRAFASRRFPNMPVEQAMQRYAVVGDEVIYKGDDGGLYKEVPTEGWSLGSLARKAASAAGPAVPVATGTLAGVATAPLVLTGPAGVATSIGATGAASAAGEAIRQKIGQEALGDPFSVGQVATEGALGALGQGVGAGLVKFAGRNVARDIGRLNIQEAQRLQELARREGVQLTPAELTGLPSLKAEQKALGNIAGTSDELMDFYLKRAGQAEEAVQRRLEAISPEDAAEIAGKKTTEAAKKAIETTKAERQAVAKPIYQSVIKPENVIPGESFSSVAGDEFLQGVIQKVKSEPLYGMKELPDSSMPVVDMAKRQLDDMIEAAKRTGENNRVRLLREKKDMLISAADEAFPDYPKARAAFSGKSPEVEALEGGIIGIIEDLPNTKLQTVAGRIFDPKSSGPLAITQAKAALKKADPEAWQAIKRAWLQQQWEAAGKQTLESGEKVVNQGAKWRKLVLGDAARQRSLKAALEPDEYEAVENLSKVLEAAGRVRPVGSDTAWNLELRAAQRAEATPAWAKAFRIARPQDWGKMVEEWATERSLKGRANEVLNVITSPQSLERLKQLKTVSPRSAQAAALVGQALKILTKPGADERETLGQQVLQSEQ